MILGFFRRSPVSLLAALKKFRARAPRPLLIARWSIAADGVLECRWESVERVLPIQR
ncbi:MAG TPA: hypothetical protein VNX61_04365 [Rhizomicrobium sp.]|nr:hypothetical protein [Rhizomicrobium sp.]